MTSPEIIFPKPSSIIHQEDDSPEDDEDFEE